MKAHAVSIFRNSLLCSGPRVKLCSSVCLQIGQCDVEYMNTQLNAPHWEDQQLICERHFMMDHHHLPPSSISLSEIVIKQDRSGDLRATNPSRRDPQTGRARFAAAAAARRRSRRRLPPTTVDAESASSADDRALLRDLLLSRRLQRTEVVRNPTSSMLDIKAGRVVRCRNNFTHVVRVLLLWGAPSSPPLVRPSLMLPLPSTIILPQNHMESDALRRLQAIYDDLKLGDSPPAPPHSASPPPPPPPTVAPTPRRVTRSAGQLATTTPQLQPVAGRSNPPLWPTNNRRQATPSSLLRPRNTTSHWTSSFEAELQSKLAKARDLMKV